MARSKRKETFQRIAATTRRLDDASTGVLRERLTSGYMSKEGAIAARQVLSARAELKRAMNPDAIEDAIVSAFVARSRRTRYRDGLANPKARAKVLSRLDHNLDDLDPSFRFPVPKSCQSTDDLATFLRSRGAPDSCFVVSCSPALDRHVMPLQEALARVVGYGMGTIISCIPGQLAYYEGEGPNERWLLERRAG